MKVKTAIKLLQELVDEYPATAELPLTVKSFAICGEEEAAKGLHVYENLDGDLTHVQLESKGYRRYRLDPDA